MEERLDLKLSVNFEALEEMNNQLIPVFKGPEMGKQFN